MFLHHNNIKISQFGRLFRKLLQYKNDYRNTQYSIYYFKIFSIIYLFRVKVN